jgi:hypothetical protein
MSNSQYENHFDFCSQGYMVFAYSPGKPVVFGEFPWGFV